MRVASKEFASCTYLSLMVSKLEPVKLVDSVSLTILAEPKEHGICFVRQRKQVSFDSVG